MQQKSESFSEFSERTEKLAAKLTLKLGELPERIGVSPAMFFAYRTGKNKISDKAWRKLEGAEREAGLIKEEPGIYGTLKPQVPAGASPQQIAGFLREEARKHFETASNFIAAANLIDPLKKNQSV